VVTGYFDKAGDQALTVRPHVWMVTAATSPRPAAPRK
jgi:hypothetical protein